MTITSEPTEAAYERRLPPGWIEVSLGEVVENQQELERHPAEAGFERYLKVEHLDADSLKIKRWGLIADGDLPPTFYKVFRKGHVLYPTRNPHLRRTAYADFDGICGEKTLTLRAIEDRLLPDLLPFLLQHERFIEHATTAMIGSTNPHVRWRDLAAYRFALPPVDEQQRIAEILWAASEEEQRHREVLRLTRIAYYSLLEQVFSRSSDSAHFKVRLGHVCTVQVGFPFRSNEFSSFGDRLLRCSNVGVERCQWEPDETRYWPTERRDEFAAYQLALGDIVIALDRPFISEGFKVAKVTSDDLPALLVQRVGRFLPTDELDREYLWAFLHCSDFRRHLKNNQQGTDLPHISRFDIESAPMYLPKLAEQRNRTEVFRAFEVSTAAANNKVQQSRQLYKDLLTQLCEVEYASANL